MSAVRSISAYRSFNLEFVARVEPVWERFWSRKKRELPAEQAWARRALDEYQRLTRGGKHLRATLVGLGWQLAGRADLPDPLLLASGSVEVLHNAFLVHDDIVDKSPVRRNAPTIHEAIKKEAAQRMAREQAAQFGNGMALNIGDLGQALSQEMLIGARFAPGPTLKCVELLDQHLENTVFGQMLDLADIPLERLTEDYVLRIHQYKTAYYTLVLPMLMGFTLAGGPEHEHPAIEEYALAVGVAFQLHDDDLGLYANEKTLGKPVSSDITEGKKTMLIVRAYERAGAEDRAALGRIHGNEGATGADLDLVREIVERTGARASSREHALGLVESAKQSLGRLNGDSAVKDLLAGVADFVVGREQ